MQCSKNMFQSILLQMNSIHEIPGLFRLLQLTKVNGYATFYVYSLCSPISISQASFWSTKTLLDILEGGPPSCFFYFPIPAYAPTPVCFLFLVLCGKSTPLGKTVLIIFFCVVLSFVFAVGLFYICSLNV